MGRKWEHDLDQAAYIADDGNWLEYGAFGRDTYGLHTEVDGFDAVIRIMGALHPDAPKGYSPTDEADGLLDRIAGGWRAANWDFCSITEAAKALGVTRQRVHAMIQEGKLEARKVGSTWAIRRSSVEGRMK